MDAVALAMLRGELMQDARVVRAAGDLARERIAGDSPAALEGCAHHLARMFNVIEQAMLRIAKAFENNIDDEKGWHAALIRRMTIRVEGVRPPFIANENVQPLHELRAFRHVWTHAYDLRLDPEKLRLLLTYASQVEPLFPGWVEDFIRRVSEMHGIDLPNT